ncbi:MAG: hypothetical protein PHD43_14920 [Methylococcales bacterium]|nr:hypothetical protein [Methylococcales bacterium]
MDIKKLMGGPDHIQESLSAYIQGFSAALRDIFERFADVDLHPDKVSNSQMWQVFEELNRKIAKISNETTGEHFNPTRSNQVNVQSAIHPKSHLRCSVSLDLPSLQRSLKIVYLKF